MDERNRSSIIESSSWGNQPPPVDARPPGLGTAPVARYTRPGFGEAILLLLVMGAATLLATVSVMIGQRGNDLDMMLLGILEASAIALVLLIGVRRTGIPARRVFGLRPAPILALIASIPLAMVMGIVSTILDAPIRAVTPMPIEFVVKLSELLYPETTLDWFRILIPAAVLVPFGEELLFRGLFLRGFLLRYGATPALALSSLLFAVVHFNPWGFVGFFTIGWLLGWYVLRTGSLWPSIFLHGLYNLFAIIQLKTALDGPPTAESLKALSDTWWESPLTIVIATAVLVGLILWLGRALRYSHPWSNDEEVYRGNVGSRKLI